jgi:hypothetical protein
MLQTGLLIRDLTVRELMRGRILTVIGWTVVLSAAAAWADRRDTGRT